MRRDSPGEAAMIFSEIHDTDITRRGVLKSLAFSGGAAAGLANFGFGAAPARAANDPRVKIDFTDPKQNLKAFTRVFSDIDPAKVAIGWYSGVGYAFVGDSKKVVPLFGLEGIGVRRTQELATGGYRVFNRELAF
jgi:hypothetical protein